MGEKSLEATFTISWEDVYTEMCESFTKEQIKKAEENKEGIMQWIRHNISDYFSFSYGQLLNDTIGMIRENQ